MSDYNQWKRNELMRDVRDSQNNDTSNVDDRLYKFVSSIPVLMTAAAVMIYTFVVGLTG